MMAKAKPGSKYLYVTVKDKKSGATKRVAMERSKALKLRRKREINTTMSLIPKPLRESVDAAGINDAVASHIASLNAARAQVGKEAQTQFDTNVRMNEQLGQQTQASLDQLLANADTRQKDYASLAGSVVSAQQQGDARAAAATGQILGGALNPLVAERAAAGMAPGQAMQYAGATQGAWADRLGQQAQRDFFERGKGIQSITQSAFNEGQRKQLTTSLQRIAAEQAANKQKRAELVRQFAQEDFTLASAFADRQAAAAQQDFENQLAVAGLEGGAGGGGGGGGARGLSSDQLKAVGKVQSDVNKLREKIGTVHSTTGSGDEKETFYWTADTVFPGTGGPLREAIARLTAANVGVGPGKAAMLAAQWYPGSITRSEPARLVPMFTRLGVPPGVQTQIMRTNGFGLEEINMAFGGTSVYGPPAPAGSKPKPRPNAPKAAATFAKQMKKRYGGTRRVWGQNEIIVLGVRARPDGRVEWQVSMKVPNGADKSKVFVTKVGQRPKFVGA